MADGMAAIRAAIGKKNDTAGKVAKGISAAPPKSAGPNAARKAAIAHRLAATKPAANDNDADDQPFGGG